MSKKYNVITLCGSTKFKDTYIEVAKQLTLAGNIVLSSNLFGHSGDYEAFDTGKEDMLAEMHRQKIDMSDEVYILNVNGYLGANTKREILYAISQKKKITYLVTCDTCAKFAGGGDFDLCCSEIHDPSKNPFGHLCYEDTPACEKYVPKSGIKEDKTEKYSKEEFVKKFCRTCGSQRCEGIGTDWFEGCVHKDKLEEIIL